MNAQNEIAAALALLGALFTQQLQATETENSNSNDTANKK